MPAENDRMSTHPAAAEHPSSGGGSSAPGAAGSIGEKLAWAIVEASPDAILLTDDDGCIVLLNGRAEAMFGYAPDELLGSTVETLVPEQCRAAHRAHRARYAAAPEAREMGSGLELRAQRRDGSEFPVEISLSPIHLDGEGRVVATIRDISVRVAAEAQDHEVRRALDLIQDGVFMFDAETLHFHYVNAGASEQVGYSRDELLTMTPLDIQPEHDRSTLAALLAPLLRDDVPSVIFTTMHRRRDGIQVPVEVLLQSPRPERSTDRRTCVLLCREVGARLRQNAELERLHLQTAVFEDRERMARTMHDNVIGRLFGTGLALEATIGRAQDETVRARLRDAVRQIDATINDIRAAVFDGDGNHVIGRNLSDEVLTLIREHHAPLGLEPHVELLGQINELDDPIAAHLLATLREALTNVSKHANATAVRVELDVDEVDVRLTVTDDGDGIPRPSTGGVSRTSGHGLRNMIARATELGGRARVSSDPGVGTTIEWIVPIEIPETD
jgi:PAS domain S-box-containing protein